MVRFCENSVSIWKYFYSEYDLIIRCLKYLSKFKWDHLTEEINYQRAVSPAQSPCPVTSMLLTIVFLQQVREQRLAAEISSAKRERDFYLSRVDRSKAMEAMRERRAAKEASEPRAPPTSDSTAIWRKKEGEMAVRHHEERGSRVRLFAQRRDKLEAPELGEDLMALLGGGRRVSQHR